MSQQGGSPQGGEVEGQNVGEKKLASTINFLLVDWLDSGIIIVR